MSSLEVVAYSLVCGELPFEGRTSELRQLHQSGTPSAPPKERKVPADVSAAILAGGP